jgi:MFS family permease
MAGHGAERGASAGGAGEATPWRTVWLIVAAGIAGAFQVGKVPVALPAIRAELGMSIAGAAWVLSIFNLIGVGAGMPMGAVIGRLGARRMTISGLALLAAASLVGAAATGAAFLLLTRFVEGIGFLMVVVGVPSLLARLVRPADLKLAFGVWGTYMPAGQAIMMIASPLLLGAIGWRGLWVANAALLALYSAVVALATRGLPAGGAPARLGELLRDMRLTASAPGPLLLALAFLAYSLQYLAVMGFLPTILVEQMHMSTLSAGLLGAIAVAANILGNLAGGVLMHRGARRWALVAAAACIMGGCELGIFLAPLPFWATYALYLLFSAGGGILPASVLGGAPVHARAPRLVPATNGLLVQGSNFGQVVGPPAVAALAEASGGWQWSPLVLTSVATLGIGAALMLRRLEARRSGAGGTLGGPGIVRR